MNAKEYIINRLKEISKTIKGISLRYAFDEVVDFHLIEVAPESTRRGDEDYMRMESDLWADFYRLYPNEDLLISDVCESNDMDNSIYDSSLVYRDIVNKILCTHIKPDRFNASDSYVKVSENNYALAA